jgi:hypothetical protein
MPSFSLHFVCYCPDPGPLSVPPGHFNKPSLVSCLPALSLLQD